MSVIFINPETLIEENGIVTDMMHGVRCRTLLLKVRSGANKIT